MKSSDFLFSPQPSQPLPRIINFWEARIGIFPEGEELLVILYGQLFVSFFLIKPA